MQQSTPVQRGRGAFSSAVAKQEGDVGPVRDGGQLDDPPHPSRAIHHMLTHTLATVSNSAGTRR